MDEKELSRKFISSIETGTPYAVVFEAAVLALCEVTYETALRAKDSSRHDIFRDYALKHISEKLSEVLALADMERRGDYKK